jgi:AcrR family transcriptional regulator
LEGFVIKSTPGGRLVQMMTFHMKEGIFMKTENDNRRVRYTKMVLKESLLYLMKTSPINKITVTDICTQADVNRGTFYLHYYDPYDLLEQIEKELLDEIMVAVDKLTKKNANSSSILKEMFEIIVKNKKLCQVILSDNGHKQFLTDIIDLTREKVITEWQNTYKDFSARDLDNLYTYTSNGTIGLILRWINGGMADTPSKLSAFVDRVSKDCILSLVSKPLN